LLPLIFLPGKTITNNLKDYLLYRLLIQQCAITTQIIAQTDADITNYKLRNTMNEEIFDVLQVAASVLVSIDTL
jgi:hypothetical protein